MSGADTISTNLRIKDYLEGEEHSGVRHEYIAGQVYAMAGGTRRHNQISGNIYTSLSRGLDGNPCQTYIGDVKVHVHTLGDDLFYYPDVVVACDPKDDHELYLERPNMIFEVLSESTERTDRQEKFHAYRSLPSLSEYVLVSQERMELTVARRENDWVAEMITSPDAVLELPSIKQSLSLSQIYRNIDFT